MTRREVFYTSVPVPTEQTALETQHQVTKQAIVPVVQQFLGRIPTVKSIIARFQPAVQPIILDVQQAQASQRNTILMYAAGAGLLLWFFMRKRRRK